MSFPKGIKILVIMKTGSKFVDKYLGHKSGVLLLEKRGRVKMKKIRSTCIYKAT